MSEFYLDAEIQQYSHLELIAKQVVEGFITGLHKSPFHGFSVEFAEHRLYNTGESTRHIDWKLYARTEKLFVKSFEEETNLRCQLVIDHSPSMFYPLGSENGNKLRFSIYAAAALMQLLKKQRDAIGMSLFAEEVSKHYPARSNQVHRKLLLNEMEKMLEIADYPEKKDSMLGASLHDIAERIPKRSLIVIFSDIIDHREQRDEIISALRHLKHNKHEVILFHVYDESTELNFEFQNRPYRFVDVESGEEMKVNPNEIKDQYLEKAKAYFEDLKLECSHFGIDFVTADIKQGFHQVLYPYLVKRSKMP
ncbi:MAG TPA: DUF58 domain-containing protein [Flavobacteriales bacterium]|nr:DUF58 domain-containing protein [Flavobacteriales bacterium]